MIDAARDALAALPGVPCTDCRYCVKGCPEGVHINTIMQSLNDVVDLQLDEIHLGMGVEHLLELFGVVVDGEAPNSTRRAAITAASRSGR